MRKLKLEISALGLKPITTQTSSKGNQQKYSNGQIWFKGDYLGYEGMSECLASALLKHSNLSPDLFVRYHLAELYDREEYLCSGCVSKSFLTQSEIFVTIGRLLKHRGITAHTVEQLPTLQERKYLVINVIRDITGLDIENYLADSLALDAVIVNEDRHLFNLGLIYNKELNSYRQAPIFDNGAGFLSDTTNYRVSTSPVIWYRKIKSKPFSSSFKKQLKLFNPTIRFCREYTGYLVTQLDTRIGYCLQVALKEYPELFI